MSGCDGASKGGYVQSGHCRVVSVAEPERGRDDTSAGRVCTVWSGGCVGKSGAYIETSQAIASRQPGGRM